MKRLKTSIEKLQRKRSVSISGKELMERRRRKDQINRNQEDRATFINYFRSDYKEQAARVKNQYRELRDLKLKLPKVLRKWILLRTIHVFLWKRSSQRAVTKQNKSPSTLLFFYFRNDEEKLSHKSSVIVSDVLSHNALTAFAFLRESITDAAKKLVPEAVFIH